MDLVNPQKNIEQKMQRSIEVLSEALKKIRTGRAHTGLLDHVQVEYYGARVPISQAANLTLMDARTIGVMPWDKKIMPVIEKAIRESDLGLNPSAQGEFLRVPMPPLTEERRRDLEGFRPRSDSRIAFSITGMIFLSHGITPIVRASISVKFAAWEIGTRAP